VIGCGHLGAVHAACMAEIGHDVLGVDVDEDKITLLNSGKACFYEPGLDEMLARNVAARRLRFTTDVSEAATFSQVHFLGVATPGRPDGSYDLSQVTAVIAALAPHLSAPSLIVGKSTVPPGTAASLRAIAADLAPAGDIDVAWNPEFLREGFAVRDTLVPDRIVIGTASESAAAILREIYQPLTDVGIPLVTTDYATAELVKGAANAFLASKISFINAMSDICTAVGGDVRTLAEALGMDPRIGKSFLRAGIGYGGACLPKDVRGLAAFAQDMGQRHASELLGIIDAINVARRERVIGLVSEVLAEAAEYPNYELSPPLSCKRLTVWGGAFKPGTDDIRDSPGLDVALRLHALGAQVTLYDPMAAGNALAAFPELSYANSAIEAADGSDALLVLTAWPEFAEITPAAIAATAGSRVVIDACQGINVAAWREVGWEVLSLTESHVRAGPAQKAQCVAVGTATVVTKLLSARLARSGPCSP
jgi:UDPglucose 6-dehydrogenase